MPEIIRPAKIFIALLLLLAVAGCQGALVQSRPIPEEEGAAYVYLQPFPLEASRLSFTVERITAVPREGAQIPLSLSLSSLSMKEAKRQRLIASGLLPPGHYSGFYLTIAKAALSQEEGEVSLVVPESPVKIEVPFSIERREASLVAVELSRFETGQQEASFLPVFSAFVPERPLPNLTGFVANRGADTLAVFNRKTYQVTGMLATGREPGGMALDPIADRVYSALSGDDAIEVVDILSGSSITKVLLSGGDLPRELALTPDGRSLLIADMGSNTVSVVDTSSLIETARIAVGDRPHSVLIDQSGRRAYVFNSNSNTISVIDIPSLRVSATVSTEAGPLRGAFSRAGDRLYVIHERSPYLIVFDTASLAVVRREYVGAGMSAIAVNPSTDLIYLGNKYDPFVSVYHPFSFLPVGYIQSVGAVSYLAVAREDNTLYMVVPMKKIVSVASLASGRIVAEMDVGLSPDWVSLTGRR